MKTTSRLARQVATWFRSWWATPSSRPRTFAHFQRPLLERLEDRLVPTAHDTFGTALALPVTASGRNHSLLSADVLPDVNTRATGALATGQVDWFQLTATEAGRLTACVAPTTGSLALRVSITGPTGQIASQSDDGSLDLHVPAGTYFLTVSAPEGSGQYQLTSTFVAALPPFENLPVDSKPHSVAVADFNGDGRPDLVTANLGYSSQGNTVSVLLGVGDGSFQKQRAFATGTGPCSVTVGDVNSDGMFDLVVANSGDGTISVLLGEGDGSFAERRNFATGANPSAVAMADLNGDGHLDIAVTSYDDGTVSILLGNGDGQFQDQRTFAVGKQPISVAVADLDGNSLPDLVVANRGPSVLLGSTLSVLLGHGNGYFQTQQTLDAGIHLNFVAVGDVNGDGRPDLITANSYDNNGTASMVSVWLNTTTAGQSPRFAVQPNIVAGDKPSAIVLADVNGDGRPDLVVGHANSTSVSVLLSTTARGASASTFDPPRDFTAGYGPVSVAVADVDGDGKFDLVTANSGPNSVSVLAGNGDGSFQEQSGFRTGFKPRAVAVADVNRDGQLDVVVATLSSPTVSVLLGNGDGTFQNERRFPTNGPVYNGVAVADLNGDGRPDLVVPLTLTINNESVNFVASLGVLLGNGDGTFQNVVHIPIGAGAQTRAVVVTDVNGDGHLDLVTANYGSNNASVLLGNGDGTFQPQQTFSAGAGPIAVATADVNGDGQVDLVTANRGTWGHTGNTVSVLLGRGNGTFQDQQTFDTGRFPYSVVAADVNGDGRPDLLTANLYDHSVSLLLNTTTPQTATATFAPQQTFEGFYYPTAVAVSDINGDGQPDLLATNWFGDSVSVLLNTREPAQTTASFAPQRPFPVPSGALPFAVAVGDVNGDGRPDLVTANYSFATASVLLGNGNGSFTPTTPADRTGSHPVPFLVDLDGDHLLDSVVRDRAGRILLRRGLPDADGPFAAAIPLNGQLHPGNDRPARDLVVLSTGSGQAIATADALPDPLLATSAAPFVYTLSLYTVATTGSVHRSTILASTALPTRLAAADLTGDGLDDLVVAHALDDSITVVLQVAPGQFTSPLTLPAGSAPSDIALVDVNGDGWRDIVVTNQVSGDVSVFSNDISHLFTTQARFRASTGVYGLDTSSTLLAVRSLAQSVSLAAGDFTGDGHNDLVVVNRGTHSFTVLPQDGRGGFSDPAVAWTTSTSDGLTINEQPGPIVGGDFNHDGQLDVAILLQDLSQIWVYLNLGHGHFGAPIKNLAGSGATSFSFLSGSPDRFQIANAFGDVLTLIGDGTGQFNVDRSHLDNRPLAVGQTSDGRQFVVVADQSQDRIHVFFRIPGTNQFSAPTSIDSHEGKLLAPGAVQLLDLNRDGLLELVVASRLSNEVLVYPGLPGGSFGSPTHFAVGNEPVSLTAAYLKGDNVLDLAVVNRGSNDVSILRGGIDPLTGLWTATPGPRLNSGGSEPIAVQVGDFTGNGIPALRVTTAQGQVTTLPGIGSNGQGSGFFRDTNLPTVDLGSGIVQAVVAPISGRELVVRTDGGISSFVAGVGFTPIFPPSGVTMIAVAGETLVAAFDDGTIGLLQPGVDGFFTLTGAAFVDQPSALEVLQSERGLEIYVTRHGSDVPVLLTAADILPVVFELPRGSDVAVSSSLPQSYLVLVAILLPGLPGQSQDREPVSLPAEEVFASLAPALQVEVSLVNQDAANPEEVESERPELGTQAPVEEEGTWEAYPLGVEDALEQRQWRRRSQQIGEQVGEVLQRLLGQVQSWWEQPGRLSAQLTRVPLDEVNNDHLYSAITVQPYCAPDNVPAHNEWQVPRLAEPVSWSCSSTAQFVQMATLLLAGVWGSSWHVSPEDEEERR